MNEWGDIRVDFCHLVACRGATFVAKAVPMGRSSVYRFIKGKTCPSPLMLAAIERVVKKYLQVEESRR